MARSIELGRGTWLSAGRFGEVGKPAGLYRDPQGRWVALASDFEAYTWPAQVRSRRQRLVRRLSLYSADMTSRLGVFGDARFPINAVAFHPSDPVLAIGTGRYDGGWSFEGELFHWNWESGEVRRLLRESREVVACRFDEHGALAVLMRPRDEEEFSGRDPFDTYVTATLPDTQDVAKRLQPGAVDPLLEDLIPVSPVNAGFESPSHLKMQARARAEHFEQLPGFRPRHRVGDLAWTDDDELAVVHDTCLLELWSTDGKLLREVAGDAHGVQLLHWGDALVVHALPRGTIETPSASRLHALDGARLRQFDRFYLFSSDAHGRLLCRDVSRPSPPASRRDLVLNHCGERLLSTDLGHYDGYNHYLRIDGDDALWFLRGDPPSSYKGKQLCRIGSGQQVEVLMPWDGADAHLLAATALLVQGDLVRAFEVYDPRPNVGSTFIERCSFTGGRIWQREVGSPVTAMVELDGELLAYALASGRFGLLELRAGNVVDEITAMYEGVPTIIQSLSVGPTGLAAGTICGNICLMAWR